MGNRIVQLISLWPCFILQIRPWYYQLHDSISLLVFVLAPSKSKDNVQECLSMDYAAVLRLLNIPTSIGISMRLSGTDDWLSKFKFWQPYLDSALKVHSNEYRHGARPIITSPVVLERASVVLRKYFRISACLPKNCGQRPLYWNVLQSEPTINYLHYHYNL